MVLFSRAQSIRKYEEVKDIVDEFYEVRMDAYAKRKEYLISKTTRELQITQMKLRFIEDVLTGRFKLHTNRDGYMKALVEMQYLKYGELPKIKSTKGNLEDDDSDKKDFDYILNMPIWSFTAEKVKELQENESRLRALRRDQENITLKEMWLHDIDEFEQAWDQTHSESSSPKKSVKNGTNRTRKEPQQTKKQKPKKKKQKDSSDEEE